MSTEEDRKAEDVAAKLAELEHCWYCFGSGYMFYSDKLKRLVKCPKCRGRRWVKKNV